MILLSFRVRNHKSLRDEVVLDLIRPSLNTLVPRDGNWAGAAYPLAAVFGGNGTGKSAILDAMTYTFRAIRDSSTAWQGRRKMVRAPFKLDEASRAEPGLYELDFVHSGRRHLYGFEVDGDGIVREWLKAIPTSRWLKVMTRERDQVVLTTGGRGLTEVNNRELVLSRALQLPKSSLHSLAKALVENFDMVSVKDSHRENRLQNIAQSLADGSMGFGDLETLLSVADIGVTKVRVEEKNIPSYVLKVLNTLDRELNERAKKAKEAKEETGEDPDAGPSEPILELDPEILEQVVRHMLFTHRGTGAECEAFTVADESDGTVAWLAIGVPALDALRNGGLLVVDEIDASLHPHLVELLLSAFSDPEVNRRHAQLIFSSHESYILSPLSEVRLEPEQIWFTDKSYEGVTELTCLADFPRHADANVAKRYLTGRYGGTPRLAPNTFAALVQSPAS